MITPWKMSRRVVREEGEREKKEKQGEAHGARSSVKTFLKVMIAPKKSNTYHT